MASAEVVEPAAGIPAKILLVAEANLARHRDPYPPLWPETGYGQRLMGILGLQQDEYLERFERANLCPYKWAMITAQKRATVLLLNAPQSQVIALFGPRVTHAFGQTFIPFTVRGRYRILPHLGKGTRAGWEFEENVERAKRLLGL